MTQEEAKQMALDDFKRRKKRLEDWLMKPIQEYKGGHGLVDRLTKK
jgi:hypothetical protein